MDEFGASWTLPGRRSGHENNGYRAGLARARRVAAQRDRGAMSDLEATTQDAAGRPITLTG